MKKWTRVQFQPGTGLGKDGARVTASPEHIALSLAAAEEGMVLLKNDRKVLPLQKGARVALFGKGTFDYVKGGGGSGDVTVSYIRNLYEGLKELGDRVSVYEDLAAFYRENVAAQYKEGKEPGMTKEPEVPAELLTKSRHFTDTAIITICRFSGEGWDRKSAYDKADSKDETDMFGIDKGETLFERGDFYLTSAEAAMVEAVSKTFPNVIVVLNVGGMIDTGWFKNNESIQGVLYALQGGMEGGLAAARLLTGLGNPSGKLVDTFAASLEDYPSTKTFHESDAYVDYVEDIYVGYRYFETLPGAKEKVVYPFGYGLSYTTFQVLVSGVTVEGNADCIRVAAAVTNTGTVPGKEVVQVYVEKPQGKLGKPAKELVGFAKTRLLAPGETQILTIGLEKYNLTSYDDLGKVAKSAYVLEHGDYILHVGTSVRDIVYSEVAYTQPADEVVVQLTKRMAPSELKERMLADGSFEALPLGEKVDTDANILTPMSEYEMEGRTPDIEFQEGWKLWDADPKDKKISLMEVYEGTHTMEEFLAQLSDRELAMLVSGQPNTGVADTFGFGNLPRFGVPNVMTADGPAGLRIRPEKGVCTTAWPCSTLLCSTWNPELVEAVGCAGGEEVKENNIAVWLTPAVNIHRSPLCGRNFEYYSEDPFLAGKLGAAMVKGIQSNHVGTSVKHFALNNKETNRKNSDSRASERAIREIYLKAFEIIVKEADPWTIMSSYNIINGYRASENADLLNGILREEWGFKGFVTTDWWNRAEQYKELVAGNDVKMGCGYPSRLMDALQKGAITRKDLEKGAVRVLEMIMKLD